MSSPLTTEHVAYTTRQYPCGCKAEGPGDVPDYCSEHGLPPALRDPIKVMERGGMLNDLMKQRDGAYAERDQCIVLLQKIRRCIGWHGTGALATEQYYCEHCHRTHEDANIIDHAPGCLVSEIDAHIAALEKPCG